MAVARLIELTGSFDHEPIGAKAAGLNWLAENDYRIPRTGVLVDAPADKQAVHSAIDGRLDPAVSYAVRSSAKVEDGDGVSYAG